MSNIAEEAGKLKLSEFLGELFVAEAIKKKPELRSDGSRLRLTRSLALKLEGNWETITVSEFLERYTLRDVRRFSNIGKKSIAWFSAFLAAFGLRLRGTTTDVGTRTVLSADAESVLVLLK